MKKPDTYEVSHKKAEATSLVESPKPDWSPANLKAMREDLGLTQKDLADLASPSWTHISTLQAIVDLEAGRDDRVTDSGRVRIRRALAEAEAARIEGRDYHPKSEADKLRERIARLEQQKASVLEPPATTKPLLATETASDKKAIRDDAIREIAALYQQWKKKNADIDFVLVCASLDKRGIAPLDIWKGKTWTEALSNQRNTVKQYIRKIIKG